MSQDALTPLLRVNEIDVSHDMSQTSNLALMSRIPLVAVLALFLQPAHSDPAISGYWQSTSGLAHFKARQAERGLSFEYVTDGAYRCEVPGIAESVHVSFRVAGVARRCCEKSSRPARAR